MRDISNLTNIIPIVTKKSTISKSEALEVKTKILEEGKNKYNINFMELDFAINVR
jgi:septin family protein